MLNELQAQTEPGRRMVALAERHAEDFAADAARHDREGSFPFAHLEALKESGFLYAPAPVECGGMGVESMHDVLVAAGRLARGDASLTLGVNMHLIIMMSYTRQRRLALNREDGPRAAAAENVLRGLINARSAIGAAVSEPDQDLLRQATTATLTDDGWILNGRKIISSMAPGATHFTVSLDYVDDNGEERYAYVIVPSDLPGVTVHDDWDALGMRASGSTSVSFENVRLPGRPGRGSPAGVLSSEYLAQYMTSGPAHAAASLGVAETAYAASVEAIAAKLKRRPDAPIRSTIQHLAAENSIDLAAMRAIFDRALAAIDDYNERNPTKHGELDDARAVYAEGQRAKAFMNAASVRIVDRAMTMTGGGAYMSAHPLSRLYRDARAGAFMQPLGANLAYEFLGAEALGLNPTTF